MIRVIYRWTVQPGAESAFLTWWHDGTMSIRRSHDGAMGSTLLRSSEASTTFVGVARWKSQEHLARFRRIADIPRFAGATLETIEVLEEIDDLMVHQ